MVEARKGGSTANFRDRISVRVNEAARLTGLSRVTLYRLIRKGDLKSAKIGQSRVILMDSLMDLISSGR